MKYTLAQIEAFVRVAQFGTFRGAARYLHRTQPAMSQRVRELESALGVRLFIRHGPQVRLTEDGHALLAYSQRLLGTASEIADHFDASRAPKGVLRIGVPTSFALVCMSEFLRRIDARFAQLKTSMHVKDSATLTRMLCNDDLDIAILVEPVAGIELEREPVGQNGLAWIAQPGNELPEVCSPSDLAARHIILPPPPSELLATVMRWFSASGVTPPRVSACDNFIGTVQSIASGLAIGVLPARVVQTDVDRRAVTFLKVVPPLPSNHVSICHRSGRLKAELVPVVALMRDVVREKRLFG